MTNEYHLFLGSDPLITTAAIVATIDAVNLVYQRDLGVTLELVANNDEVYEVVDLGQLNNNNRDDLLDEVNNWIDTNLTNGDTAYDIGHMFYLNALEGGAFLGVVCNDTLKASGVSSTPDPLIGDAFDIDLVAHEIGHQFNAEHTFNGTDGSCLVNRNAVTAYEPGSGSTIMAYAGICGAEDLQSTSEVTYHAGSIEAINGFTTTGSGSSCYALVATAPNAGNTDPVVAAIADSVIPANTAFVLNGIASDVDPNTLSYQWDQMDTGCPTDSASFGTDNGSNPLFRSYVPRGQGLRNFPALGTQREGKFDKAEVLPCQNRDLDFRLTARDGNSGQDFEDVRLTVNNAAGPFVITNLDPDPGTIFAGTAFQVTWDPADTDLPPISCADVDIDLLTFNLGPPFSYSKLRLATSVSNIAGSAMVTIDPVNATATHSRARVRVKCSDNVFYDISDADLNVQTVNTPAPLGDTDLLAYTYEKPALAGLTAPVCGAIASCPTPVIPPTSRGGNGDASAFGYNWMLLLAGLALVRHRRLLFTDGSAS